MPRFSAFSKAFFFALTFGFLGFFAAHGQSKIEFERCPGYSAGMAFDGEIFWQNVQSMLLKKDLATGETIQKFDPPPQAPFLASMKKGPNGHLWFSLDAKGVGRFDGGEWTVWSGFFPSTHRVQSVLPAADGHVWAWTQPVNSLDPSRTYFFDGSIWQEDPALTGIDVRGMAESAAGELVLCSRDTLLRRSNGAWAPLQEPPGAPANEFALPVFAPDGKFWIQRYSNRYYRYDDLAASPTLVASVPGTFAQLFLIDQNGGLFAGESGRGLMRWNGNDFTSLPIMAGSSSITGLVADLALDPMGRLWVGSNFGGTVLLFENGAVKKNAHFGSQSVQVLGRDRVGNIWQKTVGPIWPRRNRATGRLEHFDTFGMESAAPFLFSKMVAGKGEDIWAIDYNGVLFHFDGQKWAVSTLAGLPGGLGEMAVDSVGRLFFAENNVLSVSDALNVFDPATASWSKIDLSSLAVGGAAFRIFGLEAGPDGSIWIAANAGLAKKSPDGSLELFAVPAANSVAKGIKVGPAGHVFVWSQSDVVGSSPFFYRFDEQSGSFSPLGASPGHQGIWQSSRSAVDASGWLWVWSEFAPPSSIRFHDGMDWKTVDAGPASGEYVQAIMPDLTGGVHFAMQSMVGFLPAEGRVEGFLRFDTDKNCSPTGDAGLKNWLVKGQSGPSEFFTLSRADGSFRLFSGAKTIEIEPVLPNPLWQTCSPASATVMVNPDSAVKKDFLIQPMVLCPRLSIDLSTPFLRRCFDNNYVGKVCNDGTATAVGAFAVVQLPIEMSFVSASPAPSILPPGDLLFPLGDIESSGCRAFSMIVKVDCPTTQIGQTLCISASVFPDSICEPTANWSGATMLLKAACEADSVRFRLKNVGKAASSTSLPFQILKNGDLEEKGFFNLAAGKERLFSLPKTGETWRLTAAQEPSHPFAPHQPSLAVEGCRTGGGPIETGFVTDFSNADGSGFSERECQTLIGAFDPNDKTSTPKGAGPSRIVAPETAVGYRIRFQNTGTDTAFTVVVRDTLDENFDPTTLVFGATSHPMRVEMRDRALAFIFENILLPDSNVNEAASHGFLNFSIRPKKDLTLGTVLFNTASIYFDFNEAVVTNTEWLTVDDLFQVSSTRNPTEKGSTMRLVVSPNPSDGQFWAKAPSLESGFFELFDAQGRRLFAVFSDGKTPASLDFSAAGEGLFWLNFRASKSGKSWAEKVVFVRR